MTTPTKADLLREAYAMAQEHYAAFGNHAWSKSMKASDFRELAKLQSAALSLMNKLYHATQAPE